MILEDEKKKVILKRLRKSAMKKFFAILAISFAFGIFVAFVMSLTDDANDMHEMLIGFGIFAFLMFLFQLDDFLVAVCMLVRCAALKKPEIKYYVAQANQIKPSPWPLHLGSRMFNRKIVVYEYEGKRRTEFTWANAMVKGKDYRLLLLVPEKKRQNFYAFPMVNFTDIIN